MHMRMKQMNLMTADLNHERKGEEIYLSYIVCKKLFGVCMYDTSSLSSKVGAIKMHASVETIWLELIVHSSTWFTRLRKMPNKVGLCRNVHKKHNM